MPGSWPTTQLKRLLCLAAEHEKLYAYSRILQLWLGRIGVPIPTKVFAKKISGPGTGPKLDKKKRAFGERAWQRQIELIIGHSDDLPEEELAARTETVWAAAPSYKASQIARELLPNRYHQGRAKREAARKYVAEAIALVKPTPEGFVDQFLSSERLDFQIDRIMGAKLPFD
jgi:hypothetical protein